METLISIFEKVLNQPEIAKSDKPYTPSFKIKPSSLGSKCLRKIYYGSVGMPEDYGFDLSGKKRMKLGDSVHEMLSSVYRKAGILIDYYNPDGSFNKDWKDPEKLDLEFPLSCEELFIKKGKIDAITIIENKLWISEYKSINSNGFKSLSAPKPEHIIQTVCYFYVFNKMLAEGKFAHIKELNGYDAAAGIRWLYVNKDDTELKEFTMTSTDTIFQEIVSKIYTIKDFYDQKTLPPKTVDWCNSCNWRDKCKKDVNIP